jgi:hypothetical protein
MLRGHVDRQTFPRLFVDECQHSQTCSIFRLVTYKIEALHVVRVIVFGANVLDRSLNLSFTQHVDDLFVARLALFYGLCSFLPAELYFSHVLF